MKKANTVIALAAILILALLMLLQQFLMPRTFSGKRWNLSRVMDMKLAEATEFGMIYYRNHAQHIAYAAAAYATAGKHSTAQKWFYKGAAEYRFPSVMVFFGDYLTYHRRFREARHWYRLALSYAMRDRQQRFMFILRKKMELLDAAEAKAVKK
jgi:hypothetical protein